MSSSETGAMSERIGYVGLGNLGVHLAMSLLKAGHEVVVTDLHRETRRTAWWRPERSWADSAAAVAAEATVVFTCLPSPAAVDAVLCGPGGILEGFAPGSTWIDNSTNDRAETLRLAARCAQRRCRDVGVPGDRRRAQGGRGRHHAAGRRRPDGVRAAPPLLEAMGQPILYMGPLGNAAIIKVITNMLAFINLVAVGEALMLAKRGGLDLATSFEAIRNSSGNSFVHETEGQVILNGSYNIGFTMDLALKDLGFAMQLGNDFGVPLELAGLVEQTFRRAKQSYGGTAWSSQVVKLLEDSVGTDLRARGLPSDTSMTGAASPALVEEARLVRQHHRLNAVAEVELLQDVGDVGLHRRLADVEVAADLGIGQASGDQAEHIELAIGQLAELSRGSGLRHPRELFDHSLRDGG